MITKSIALTLKRGDILHHKTRLNRDGTPQRCRVNGKAKTWKTRPNDFTLPVKHGLRICFRIESGFDAADWQVA